MFLFKSANNQHITINCFLSLTTKNCCITQSEKAKRTLACDWVVYVCISRTLAYQVKHVMNICNKNSFFSTINISVYVTSGRRSRSSGRTLSAAFYVAVFTFICLCEGFAHFVWSEDTQKEVLLDPPHLLAPLVEMY